jgi:hypothetical protein
LENITDIQIINRTRTATNLRLPVKSIDLVTANEAVDNLITEGGEDFYNYVNRIGLATDPDLIVLSSIHSYFYDTEEMNNARTVINLKELNRIKDLTSLLHSHLTSLPLSCNFVGCFFNNEKVERYGLRNSSFSSEKIKNLDALALGIVSRFPLINRLYSLMDLKTNTYMSESSVTLLLKDNGFKVMDMTEFNGLTFFHSQKVGHIYN